MAEFPALPLWTDAWVADTHHLSRLSRGLYMDLLILMWRTPFCRVPNDEGWLTMRLRLLDGEFDNLLKPLIKDLCNCNAGWITQKRLQREYAWVAAKRDAQREKAKQRWQKEKDECKSNAPTPTPTPTPTPLKKDSSGRAASPRATRWPHDCKVPSEWMGDAQVARLRNMLSEVDVMLEAEKFANFWSAKSGANATKIDWHKTWINWALRAEAPRHGNKTTAHDKFLAAGLSLIVNNIGDQPAGDSAEDNGPDGPGRPLLPP